jgi:hypothetical protein
MSGKFRKRDIERKGAEKETVKDKKLLHKNAKDLARPDKLNQEFEKETEPGVKGVTSQLRKREGI